MYNSGLIHSIQNDSVLRTDCERKENNDAEQEQIHLLFDLLKQHRIETMFNALKVNEIN